MDTTNAVLGKRLITLMGNVHFRSDFDKALDSPEHLIAIGEHNLREYEKIEAMGEERKERIWNLLSAIFAIVFQKMAMDEHGNTDDSSIREVLQSCFSRPENKAYFDKLRQTTERAVLGCGLTEEQCQEVMKCVYDRLPEIIREYFTELYRLSRYLPRSEAQPITTALADMMREVTNVDSQRHN